MIDTTEHKKNGSRIDIDPVSGMSVIPDETKLVAIYNGKGYWFFSKTCRE